MRGDLGGSAFTIALRPMEILLCLLGVTGTLLVAHVVTLVYRMASGDALPYGVVAFFDLSEERNAPTLFSASMLLISAALFVVIATLHRRLGEPWIAWMILSALFCFLAIDETATIHERLMLPVRNLLDARGALFYAWVIPYGVATAVLALLYLPFLLRLPPRTRTLLCLAALAYLGGALGMELVGGLFATPGGYGSDRPLFFVVSTIEETLEMLGVCLLIYGLCDYLTRVFPAFSLRLAGSGSRSGS